MSAPTGFTSVTAAKIQDASGHLLANGRVTFYLVAVPSGAPVSAIAGGGGGVITQIGVVFLVVAGAITTDIYGNSAQVADVTLTNPVNIAYRVTVTDAGGVDVQGPGYGLVQPSGATWSLDTAVPIGQPGVTLQPGLQGPAGPANTLTVTATTLPASSAATAVITGTAPNQALALGIPGMGFSFRGAYSGAVAYSLNNVVTWLGSAYVYIAAYDGNVNFQPDISSTKWSQIVAAGSIGPTGVVGPAGPTGLISASSGLVLNDLTNTFTYVLQMSSGRPQFTKIATSAGAVSGVSIADLVNGHTYLLQLSGGQPQYTQTS